MKIEVVLRMEADLYDAPGSFSKVGVLALELRRDIEFGALPEVGQEVEFTEGAPGSKARDNTQDWEGEVQRVNHRPLAGDGRATIQMTVEVTVLAFGGPDSAKEFEEIMEGLGWKLISSYLHKEAQTESVVEA